MYPDWTDCTLTPYWSQVAPLLLTGHRLHLYSLLVTGCTLTGQIGHRLHLYSLLVTGCTLTGQIGHRLHLYFYWSQAAPLLLTGHRLYPDWTDCTFTPYWSQAEPLLDRLVTGCTFTGQTGHRLHLYSLLVTGCTLTGQIGHRLHLYPLLVTGCTFTLYWSQAVPLHLTG